jgi:hypothetical protein
MADDLGQGSQSYVGAVVMVRPLLSKQEPHLADGP